MSETEEGFRVDLVNTAQRRIAELRADELAANTNGQTEQVECLRQQYLRLVCSLQRLQEEWQGHNKYPNALGMLTELINQIEESGR